MGFRALSLLAAVGLTAFDVTATDLDDLIDDLDQIPAESVRDGLVVPEVYEFSSRFVTGESSVSYSGQIPRHILIEDLKAYIGNRGVRVNAAQ